MPVFDNKGNRIYSPLATHPGPLIQEELEYRKIDTKDFATKLGMMHHHLKELMTGKRNMTAMIALKLEEHLDIEADFWMRVQGGYELTLARNKRLTASKRKATTSGRKPATSTVKTKRVGLH